jgi:hypothetical protein
LRAVPDPEDLRVAPDPEDLRVADDPLEALRPPEPERAALADAERARVPEPERDDFEPPELLDELAFVALAPDRGDDDLPAAEPELLPAARERGDDAAPDDAGPDDELPLGAEPPLVERGDRRRAGDAEEPLLDPDDVRFLDVLRRGPPLSFSTAISSSLSSRDRDLLGATLDIKQEKPAYALPDARALYTQTPRMHVRVHTRVMGRGAQPAALARTSPIGRPP